MRMIIEPVRSSGATRTGLPDLACWGETKVTHSNYSIKKLYVLAALAGVGLAAASASASPITFSASAGTRAASVTFAAGGSDLIVTLENTSVSDVLVPVDVLTAVFFDIHGSPLSLARGSAVVPAGSSVLFGGTDPGGVVGGEWAYRSGLAGPYGAAYGISSSGLDFFGPGDLFPGSNLQGPASPGGLQYGITSWGDDPATGNTPVTGTNALIKNSVVFTLSGLPAGFDPAASISAVTFQYGTSLSEPQIHAPEPATLALLVVAGALGFRRR